MANNNLGRDVVGWLANLVAPGKVYNTYTNRYAPTPVTAGRLMSGVAGQMGPAGSIAGMIGAKVIDGRSDAQYFDRGLETSKGLAPEFNANQSGMLRSLQGPQIDNIGGGGQVNVGSMQNIGMPQVGGWRSGDPTQGRGFGGMIAPTTGWGRNGQANFDANHASQLQAKEQQIASQLSARLNSGGMQQQQQYRAAQDSFKSMRGDYASPNSFQAGSGDSIFGGSGRYTF